MSFEYYLFSFYLFCYAGYAWVTEHSTKKYLNCGKHNGKIFTLLLFLTYIVGNAICLFVSYPVGILLSHITIFVLTLVLFQAETEKKLLTAAIFLGCMRLTNQFLSSFVYFLLLLYSYGMEKDPTTVYSVKTEYFILILQLVGYTVVIHFLEKPLLSILNGKVKKWYLMSAIPIIILTVVQDIAEWAATKGIMFRGEDRWNLSYNQLFSYGANLLLALLCMCIEYFYILGMDRIYMEQKRKEQYQAKVEVYNMLEEQYRKMERLRHDMKNHIIGLYALLEQKEWEKMKDYLQQMAITGAFDKSEDTTGNQVVDALLYQKRKEAKKNKIQWAVDLQIPKKCGIEDFDFCVLIGNILDNAIEACNKLGESPEKFISIHSDIQKSFFLLEVKNSTSLKDMGPVIYTDKSKQLRHGIGLLNVLETSQKYNGTIETELKHRVFTISVLLPIPKL